MFENLLMQLPTSGDPLHDIVAIVIAVGAICTAIGNHFNFSGKFKKVGTYMTTFGQKTAEQQGEMYAVVSALNTAAPEVQAVLAKYGKDIAYWKNRAQTAEQQIQAVTEPLPENMKADNKVMPRESFATRTNINTA